MTSDFFEQVWAIVKLIPPGRVTTYGAIAKALGSPGASRTVGYAMNACDKSMPAHRVVNRNGRLTGKFHFTPPSSMAERLASEGIIVINDEIEHFENHFWDPVSEWQSM
jgi:methylated-DNA-protein-cysteine methyltransferase related protein